MIDKKYPYNPFESDTLHLAAPPGGPRRGALPSALMLQQFNQPQGGLAGATANAHENIDTLITDNKNKDFFELIKGMIPSPNVAENFHPVIGAQKLIQLMSGNPQEVNALFKGIGESAFGEPDPIGPQGLPFSQFMQQKQQRKQLDPKVKSIVNQHVNGLFKK